MRRRIIPLFRSKVLARPGTFGLATYDGVPMVPNVDDQGNLWTIAMRPKGETFNSAPAVGVVATVTSGQFGSDRGEVDYIMAQYITGAAPAMKTVQLTDAGATVLWTGRLMAPANSMAQIILPQCSFVTGTNVLQKVTLAFTAAPEADAYEVLSMHAFDPGIG